MESQKRQRTADGEAACVATYYYHPVRLVLYGLPDVVVEDNVNLNKELRSDRIFAGTMRKIEPLRRIFQHGMMATYDARADLREEGGNFHFHMMKVGLKRRAEIAIGQKQALARKIRFIKSEITRRDAWQMCNVEIEKSLYYLRAFQYLDESVVKAVQQLQDERQSPFPNEKFVHIIQD